MEITSHTINDAGSTSRDPAKMRIRKPLCEMLKQVQHDSSNVKTQYVLRKGCKGLGTLFKCFFPHLNNYETPPPARPRFF
jgi:hypothetical protein